VYNVGEMKRCKYCMSHYFAEGSDKECNHIIHK